MMGPSCRRKTLFKNSKINQQNSVDASKNVKNVDTSCNNSSNACSTPKAKRYRIPEINTCPPAPKKRRNIVRNWSLRRTSPVPFFAPPDIELFFYFALRGIPV